MVADFRSLAQSSSNGDSICIDSMLEDAKAEEESGRNRRSTQSDAVQADLDSVIEELNQPRKCLRSEPSKLDSIIQKKEDFCSFKTPLSTASRNSAVNEFLDLDKTRLRLKKCATKGRSLYLAQKEAPVPDLQRLGFVPKNASIQNTTSFTSIMLS